jgi:hypothetical protein
MVLGLGSSPMVTTVRRRPWQVRPWVSAPLTSLFPTFRPGRRGRDLVRGFVADPLRGTCTSRAKQRMQSLENRKLIILYGVPSLNIDTTWEIQICNVSLIYLLGCAARTWYGVDCIAPTPDYYSIPFLHVAGTMHLNSTKLLRLLPQYGVLCTHNMYCSLQHA